MGTPRAVNLNFRIPWQEVCAALQIPIRSQALPLCTICPACRKEALNLSHDNITGGVWHQCRACGISGDMIELASTIWQTDAVVSLRRLAESGVNVPDDCLEPARITSYMLRPDARRRMQQLWLAGRNHYLDSQAGSIIAIRQKYGLHFDASLERWQNGPGRLLGAVHWTQVDKAYQPNKADTSKGSFKPIPGRGWDEVLLTPFYDLPGRIRAFGFMGRRGDPATDQLFKTVPHISAASEAGIGLLDAVGQAGDPMEILAVDNWLFGLQVHMRNFRTSMRTLPLVAWHDDGNKRTSCWRSVLPGKRIVFWSPWKMDHRVIMQAVSCDGWISMVGPVEPDTASLAIYLRRYAISDTQRNIFQHAAPWAKALRNWLKNTASDNQAFELFSRLEQAGADVSMIMRAAGSRDRLRGLPSIQLRVSIGDISVVEQGDTWQVAKTHRIGNLKQSRCSEILNCVLELNEAIKDRDTGELFYHGVIRYKGTVVPFIERLEVIQYNTSVWLQAKLAEYNLGVLVADHSWRARLHQLAVAFREPRFIVDDLYKWVHKLKKENDACAEA